MKSADLKTYAITALIAMVVVYASNNVDAVEDLIG
jgi:hypothetical protein